tara:strand:+ start:456 stop:647 length:192 start_codon:yes stop_codon:yes gene_type:complete
MKAGDLVRFHTENRMTEKIHWKTGLLVEYQTWEKVARILYEGKLISVHASKATLAKNGRAIGD